MNAKACLCAALLAAVLSPCVAGARKPAASATPSHEEAREALFKIRTVAVLPPRTVYVRKVFDGPDEPMPGRERAIRNSLGGHLVALVESTNLQALTPRPDWSEEQARAVDFDTNQLFAALGANSFDDRSNNAARPTRLALGSTAPGRLAERFNADALLLVAYSGFVKSAGQRASEGAIQGLTMGVRGRATVPEMEGGTVTLILIDGASGDVLWASRAKHAKLPPKSDSRFETRVGPTPIPTLREAVIAAFGSFPISRAPVAPVGRQTPQNTTVDLNDLPLEPSAK